MKKLIYAIAMVMLFANCDDEEEIKNNIEFTLTEFNIGITSATAEVILEDIEGYSIENSGVAYATSETPTTDDMTYAAQFEDDRISVNLSDLTADTTYYARAYVNVGDNVLYSSQMSFKTKAIDEASPILMTPVFEGVSATKVYVESNAVNNADYGTISEVGFVFMKDGMADVTTMVETEDFSSLSAEFEVVQGNTYSVKSYAVNEFGTFYSEVTAIVADWVEESTPLMTIGAPSDITDMTATFTADVTDDKDYNILSIGFVYGTSEELEEGSITVESGNESFSFDVQNLEGGTMYYVKAYAENMYGVFYGETISFMTEYTYKEHDGDVILGSQEDVDMFASEKYTDIDGNLTIGVYQDEDEDEDDRRAYVEAISNKKRRSARVNTEYRMEEPDMPTSDISDISGLISVSSIKGSLDIVGNPNLTSLEGLNNVNLIISEGPPMEGPPMEGPPMEGPPMEGPPVEEPSGFVYIGYNDSLTNLVGLESLIDAFHLIIDSNNSLVNLEGLNNLDLIISEEPMMGPPSGFVYIYENPSLISLSGLDSVDSLSYIDIEYNNSLIDLDGLQGLTSVSDDVYIYGNSSLTSLSGLDNLESLGSLDIEYNDNLLNLNGLQGLANVSYEIYISENPSLTSLLGLENLIYAYSVYIDNNLLLSSYCGLNALVSASINGEPSFEVYFGASGNLYNPSYEDLIEGDCAAD
ncbi:MAG: hypothetical protein HRT66_04080 [Flavobacteriaceae bacterium]|nr:hypothetical protein [Flavobacteriaceae bacterium]